MEQEPPNQEVKLVQPKMINTWPLPAHGEQEDREVVQSEREMEVRQERRETFNKVSLDGSLVGVPYAVEEALPELLHVCVGNLVLRRKPCSDEVAEGAVTDGLVAGSEFLDQ